MNRYIEVTGEGSYRESAARYVADVTLEMRAAKDETAFSEVSTLRDEAVAVLLSSGIEKDELTEGGTEFQRPWFWRKKVGQSVGRKIILRVRDFDRLTKALESLEPLQSGNKQRKTISVDMRQPEFDDSGEAKADALAMAFLEAQTKASVLASKMNVELRHVISFEEGRKSKRNSGFTGDSDWGGDDDRFGMGGAILMAAAPGGDSEESDYTLEAPTRTIYVTCRVRFEVADP